MNSAPSLLGILSFFLLGILTLNQCSGTTVNTQLAFLHVDASEASAKKIPNTLFGLFFEEINHAGAGGLWAELVSNRGFEAGGQNTPSNIDPWSIIGDESSLTVSTERSSCFERNKIALRLDIHCGNKGANTCPYGGVGVSNPGFWGMNIEEGKSYKLVFHVRSLESLNVSASLTSSDGLRKLASAEIISGDVSNWTKIEVVLVAKGTDHNSRLELTTTKSGVIWFDQVSLMPLDTYKGHGFRNDLFGMIKYLKPGFLRFPGGCFVEGEWLRNAFRWKETIGPWEERSGHFGDVWHYWTDDGLGHLEFLQLAEDLGALPVWVFNNGISHNDQVDTSSILPFVQEILDGIEFARGGPTSTWGSVRAALGHPEPFDLRYVAIGNEDCWKSKYRGNYLKFYSAIKQAYPDINIISNCDASSQPLNHPADLYDYHIYSSASDVFSLANKFNHVSRSGPKAFVSEYAVTAKQDCGKGSLLAALAEAGFLIGVERNGDAVEMASYAPLFVNENDRTWSPDAIVFTSSQAYGTPSYWMQQFFRESNGATLLNSTLTSNISSSLLASAITWQNPDDNHEYLRIKAVNFGASNVTLKITVDGLEQNSKQLLGSTKTLLTSSNVLDENSFTEPTKVTPTKSLLQMTGEKLDVVLLPHSLTSFDFLLKPNGIRTLESDSDHKSSY